MIRKNLKGIFDIVLVILLFITAIKKGGFYKTDSLFVNLVLVIISILYFLVNKFEYKNDKLSVLFLFLGVSYCLPIIFKNYANISDSIYEMIRYFNIYAIYVIVRGAENKKIYVSSILLVTFFVCLLGIDSIASRVFIKLLKSINSGYLSINLDRMSSTIQYANIFAVMCSIAIIFLINELKNTYNSRIKCTIYMILLWIYNTCMILSLCRSVLVLLTIFLIIYFICCKTNNKESIILVVVNFVLSFVTSGIVHLYIQKVPINIYFVFLLMSLFVILVYQVIYSVLKKFKYYIHEISIQKIILLSVTAIVIYFILAFNISTSIKMDSNSTVETIYLYNLDKISKNDINLKINTFIPDTRYRVTFIVIDNNFESKIVKQINYYQTTTDDISLCLEKDENIKCLKIDIECSKGSLEISNVLVNGKIKKIRYPLIPYKIIDRVNDALTNSTSIRDRKLYIIDSFKIITSSFKNFIIGTGGEGFKNLFKNYRSIPYISTEVHNSYIQTFVETGVIGFFIMIAITINIIIYKKNDIYKLVVLFILCHSVIDLDFSYFVMMYIFAIICGLMSDKVVKEKSNLWILESSLYIPISFILLYILIRSTINYYM